jgi:hypothetical protein
MHKTEALMTLADAGFTSKYIEILPEQSREIAFARAWSPRGKYCRIGIGADGTVRISCGKGHQSEHDDVESLRAELTNLEPHPQADITTDDYTTLALADESAD